MDVVLLLGRVLFGAPFVTSAIGHLTRTLAMAGYAASRGVPTLFWVFSNDPALTLTAPYSESQPARIEVADDPGR
jgi:uncharacterized membrane protein YphA (DoxX/SURF4 family)